MNKELIKTIAIIVLVIAVLTIFLLPKYNQAIYEKGVSDGQISIAQTQTQTGNVFIIENETIKSYSIQQICGGGE